MTYVHKQSCECTMSQLDLFSVPPAQTSIVDGKWVDHHPISTLTDQAPIEFCVTGGDEYIDLSECFLTVRAKVTNADGMDIVEEAAVGPTNLFLHSLFSQIDVSLNGRLVSQSSSTYPYRSLLETLLSYQKGALDSQLTSSLFFRDTPGKMDIANPYAAGGNYNLGLRRRAAYTDASRVVDLTGRIHSDIFNQSRSLIGGVEMKLKLHRSKDAFCLMSPADGAAFKVRILEAMLHVRQVKVSPTVALAHAKALEKTTAKYPVTRVLIKSFTIPQGDLSVSRENVFLGQLPKRIIVGLVNNASLNGTYKLNPFNFHHYNVNKIGVNVDGHQLPSSRPLTPKFSAGGGKEYIQAYQTLYSGLNGLHKDTGSIISRDDYGNGYTLYAYNLAPDLGDHDHYSLQKTGNLRLELNFSEPLPHSVNVVVLAEFDNVIQIDKSRTVLYDYNSG